MNDQEIKPGQIWKLQARHEKDSIIVKVLDVFPDRVFIMRRTGYGFIDLKPMSLSRDEFLFLYDYVGEVLY